MLLFRKQKQFETNISTLKQMFPHYVSKNVANYIVGSRFDTSIMQSAVIQDICLKNIATSPTTQVFKRKNLERVVLACTPLHLLGSSLEAKKGF